MQNRFSNSSDLPALLSAKKTSAQGMNCPPRVTPPCTSRTQRLLALKR